LSLKLACAHIRVSFEFQIGQPILEMVEGFLLGSCNLSMCNFKLQPQLVQSLKHKSAVSTSFQISRLDLIALKQACNGFVIKLLEKIGTSIPVHNESGRHADSLS
jgi:hypothetical protein